MGIRLVAEVLDHAPADLTPAERLVLVVLAEAANDETRECWPGVDRIARRSGLAPDSVRRVFQRLARRSLEVRVPIGKTGAGKPVFAREGSKTTYRIPHLLRRDDNPASHPSRDHSPATEAGPRSQRGGTVVPERRDESPALTLNEPSVEPSPHGGARAGTTVPPQPERANAPIDDDGFALTDAMRAWAIRTFGNALDIDHETALFIDHHRAQGSRRRNWPAEWQKWMRRSAKFAAERRQRTVVPFRAPGQPRPSTTDARVAAALELGRQMQADADARASAQGDPA